MSDGSVQLVVEVGIHLVHELRRTRKFMYSDNNTGPAGLPKPAVSVKVSLWVCEA